MIRDLLYHQKDWDKIAVIRDGQSFTYRDLARKATALQKRLPTKHQENRTNIALFLPNGEDYIATLYGILMTGLTAFPLSIQLTAHEIAPLLNLAKVHTVVTSLEYRLLFDSLFTNFTEECTGDSETLPYIIYIEELVVDSADDFPMLADTAPDEPMILLSTSGTTGNAKIVQLSERNAATSTLGFIAHNDYAKFGEDKIKYTLWTPFSSVYGLMILSVVLVKSFPLVIISKPFTLDVLYMAVERYKVTHYEGGTVAPLLMDQTAGRPISHDISSLKFVGFGGSKVTADMFRRLARAFPNIEFCQGYGSTEASSLIARTYKKVLEDKLDAVGIAIPEVTVWIEVEGTLTDVPFTTGEIVVQGPNVMMGYYNNEAETRKVIKDGCLYTGDIGYLDEDGFVYLCGRKKNVIMVRGFSVYAEEVEACLLKSGLIDECIVYGETDAQGSETVCTDVVLKTSQNTQTQIDDLRAHCREVLAAYKQPQKIQIVESIRKTSTGKAERTGSSGGF